jgi:ornithine cyclodeaminase/alanine dehydrogenase-like protein (mu-crystallin family)
MIHLLILAVHLLATIAKLVRPGGVRAVVEDFGLGVLDMAVARFVYEQAIAEGTATAIDDFFASD